MITLLTEGMKEEAEAARRVVARLLNNCEARRQRAREKAFGWINQSNCTSCGHGIGERTWGTVDAKAEAKYKLEDKLQGKLWRMNWELMDRIEGVRLLEQNCPSIEDIEELVK